MTAAPVALLVLAVALLVWPPPSRAVRRLTAGLTPGLITGPTDPTVPDAHGPLRRRVQSLVDRRFDRARYNAERVVTQFSVQLRDQVDLDVLGEGLLGVVDDVLAPAHLSLWLRGPGPLG